MCIQRRPGGSVGAPRETISHVALLAIHDVTVILRGVFRQNRPLPSTPAHSLSVILAARTSAGGGSHARRLSISPLPVILNNVKDPRAQRSVSASAKGRLWNCAQVNAAADRVTCGIVRRQLRCRCAHASLRAGILHVVQDDSQKNLTMGSRSMQTCPSCVRHSCRDDVKVLSDEKRRMPSYPSRCSDTAVLYTYRVNGEASEDMLVLIHRPASAATIALAHGQIVTPTG